MGRKANIAVIGESGSDQLKLLKDLPDGAKTIAVGSVDQLLGDCHCHISDKFSCTLTAQTPNRMYQNDSQF